jgi:hypothetical protein
MPKYRVVLVTSASTSVDVEADSPEEAVVAAQEGNLPGLCHQCAGGYRGYGNPELILGDDWDVPRGENDGPLSDWVTEAED